MCVFIQSCLTLCDPMDCSPSGSSVHGILQAIILECRKKLPAMLEIWVQSLDWEDPLEKGKATYSTILCNPEIPAFPGEEY